MFLRKRDFYKFFSLIYIFLIFLQNCFYLQLLLFFSKYKSGEEYTCHTDQFIQIVMKMEAVYLSYTDDLLSNFTLVRSTVYVCIVCTFVLFETEYYLFIYKTSPVL
jgi:hypothetical protein